MKSRYLFTQTPEYKEKMSKVMTGIKFSDEHKNRISSALLLYKKTKKHCQNISKAKTGIKLSKETIEKLSKKWDECCYHSKHYKVKKLYGKADKCEVKICSSKSKLYDWANLSGKYHTIDRSDWMMMCKRCHNLYDRNTTIKEIVQKQLEMEVLDVK